MKIKEVNLLSVSGRGVLFLSVMYHKLLKTSKYNYDKEYLRSLLGLYITFTEVVIHVGYFEWRISKKKKVDVDQPKPQPKKTSLRNTKDAIAVRRISKENLIIQYKLIKSKTSTLSRNRRDLIEERVGQLISLGAIKESELK